MDGLSMGLRCSELWGGYDRLVELYQNALESESKHRYRKDIFLLLRRAAESNEQLLVPLAQKLTIQEPWARGIADCIQQHHTAKAFKSGVAKVAEFFDLVTQLDQAIRQFKHPDTIYLKLSQLVEVYEALLNDSQWKKVGVLRHLRDANCLWVKEFAEIAERDSHLGAFKAAISAKTAVAEKLATRSLRRRLRQALEQCIQPEDAIQHDLSNAAPDLLSKALETVFQSGSDAVQLTLKQGQIPSVLALLHHLPIATELYLRLLGCETGQWEAWEALGTLMNMPNVFVSLEGLARLDDTTINVAQCSLIQKQRSRIIFPHLRELVLTEEKLAPVFLEVRGQLARSCPALCHLTLSPSSEISADKLRGLVQDCTHLRQLSLAPKEVDEVIDVLIHLSGLRKVFLQDIPPPNGMALAKLLTRSHQLESINVVGGSDFLQVALDELTVREDERTYVVSAKESIRLDTLSRRMQLRPYLRTLRLRGNFLGEEQVPVFPILKNLTELDLMGSKLTHQQLSALLKMAPNLKIIHLSDIHGCPYHVDLADYPPLVVKRVLGALKHVKSLTLAGEKIPVSELQKWGKKTWMRDLRFLFLHDLRMPYSHLKLLVDWLSSRERLQGFTLPKPTGRTECRLVIPKAWENGSLQGRSLIQCLEMNVANLDNVLLQKSTGKKLRTVRSAGISGLHSIGTRADCRPNPIPDVTHAYPWDLQLLFAHSAVKNLYFPDLTYLDASDVVGLTDERLRKLALGAEKLTTLKLQRCPPLCADTLQELLNAHSKTLAYLDLSGCAWMNLNYLNKLELPESLKQLRVEDCSLTPSVVDRFQKKLASTKVKVHAHFANPGWTEIYDEYVEQIKNTKSPSKPILIPGIDIELPTSTPPEWVKILLDYKVLLRLPCVEGTSALKLGNYAAERGLSHLAQHCWHRYVYGLNSSEVLERMEYAKEGLSFADRLIRLKFEALFHPYLPSLLKPFTNRHPKTVHELYVHSTPVSEKKLALTSSQPLRFSFNEDTADVTFIFDDGSKERAHKNILRLRSSYFAAMFSRLHPTCESSQEEIQLPGTEVEDFKILKDYLYSGQLPEVDQNNSEIVNRRFCCADYFQVNDLAKHLQGHVGK